MRPTTILTAIVALSGLLAASPPATAAPSGYTFTAINPPGEPQGYGIGINNLGQIVGSFADSAGVVHAFLDSGGQFTTIDPPGAGLSFAVAINNQAQILGNAHSIGNFVLDHGVYNRVSAPGSATGINDQGQIVGTVCGTVTCHGYIDTRGSITLINVPGGSARPPELLTTPDRSLEIMIPARELMVSSTHEVSLSRLMCRARHLRRPPASMAGVRSSDSSPTAQA
jgi:probable HAF family extracellular repeat protein